MARPKAAVGELRAVHQLRAVGSSEQAALAELRRSGYTSCTPEARRGSTSMCETCTRALGVLFRWPKWRAPPETDPWDSQLAPAASTGEVER